MMRSRMVWRWLFAVMAGGLLTAPIHEGISWAQTGAPPPPAAPALSGAKVTAPPAATCRALEDSRAQAVFLGPDETTRGDWIGKYGRDGHVLNSFNGAGKDRKSLPAYLDSYAYSAGTQFYVWNGNTRDARAIASPEGRRVAATAHSQKPFTISFTAKDNRPHSLAFYLLDWDSTSRAFDITILDAASGKVLDKQHAANISRGVYYVYQVKGSIKVKFTKTAGHNAVVSGIFWDPHATPNSADVSSAIGEIRDGGASDRGFIVRRGGDSFRLTVEGTPGGAGGAGAPAHGVIGRYLTGPGYGRLIEERHDKALSFSWWKDPRDGFPGAKAAAAKAPLWAEWEGTLGLPHGSGSRIAKLPQGQAFGLSTGPAGDGACVKSVAPGSPAESAGLQKGDVITRILAKTNRIATKISLRLDAPLGGHVFVDGSRLLWNIPCGIPGLNECKQKSRIEVTRTFHGGARHLRMAGVRGSAKDEKAGKPKKGAKGPVLSWRLPGMKQFIPVPPGVLRPASVPGTWKRTPRQAAQVGLEWLQSSALEWQGKHKCYGCHVQAQAMVAMAIGRDNEYVVSKTAYNKLLSGISSFQNKNGTWHNGAYASSTQFGAIALATAHLRGGEGRNQHLLKSIRYLLKIQDKNGRIALKRNIRPIEQGDFLSTANSRAAFTIAAKLAAPDEAAKIRNGEKKALAWLAKAKPVTNQDMAMRILGLATTNPKDRAGIAGILAAARGQLLKSQLKDGGWAELKKMKSNAFATGQALYALRMAGQSIASEPFQRGVEWLLVNQLWTGAWPQMNSQRRKGTQYAATMWPVVALVGSFRAVGVEISKSLAESCLENATEVSARIVTDEKVDEIRLLIDGKLVGAMALKTGSATHSVTWDPASVAPGLHEIRVEAVRDGKVRGEDQTSLYTAAKGQCDGTLSVLAPDKIIARLAPLDIELILDASGSMRGRNREGITRITAAKRVMRDIVSKLPGNSRVGLRVYGHRYASKPKGKSCTDSQLVVPFGPVNRKALVKAINAIKPRGQTPIGLSLRQLEKDFRNTPGQKLVVLVTDGIETCANQPGHPDYPPVVVRQLMDKGLKLRVNIVGFDIGDSITRDFLADLAGISGGSYYPAGSTRELQRAIRQAMQVSFTVTDASGAKVAQGSVGTHLSLATGHYTVRLAALKNIEIESVQIKPGQDTRLLLGAKRKKMTLVRSIVAPDTPLPPGVRIMAPIAPPAASVRRSPAEIRAARIQRLLDNARMLTDEKRLTTPAGSSAVDRYRQVLALAPGNATAKAGLEEIAGIYQGWARANMGKKDYGKAIQYLDKAIAVGGERPGLVALREKARKRVRDAQLASRAQARAQAEIRARAEAEAKARAEARARAEEEAKRRRLARRSPDRAPIASPSLPPVLSGVPGVIDSATLIFGKNRASLYGVQSLGGAYRRGLEQYIAGRRVKCSLVSSKRYRCVVGGWDLSEAVLINGAARAAGDATRRLRDAEATARRGRKGVWSR